MPGTSDIAAINARQAQALTLLLNPENTGKDPRVKDFLKTFEHFLLDAEREDAPDEYCKVKIKSFIAAKYAARFDLARLGDAGPVVARQAVAAAMKAVAESYQPQWPELLYGAQEVLGRTLVQLATFEPLESRPATLRRACAAFEQSILGARADETGEYARGSRMRPAYIFSGAHNLGVAMRGLGFWPNIQTLLADQPRGLNLIVCKSWKISDLKTYSADHAELTLAVNALDAPHVLRLLRRGVSPLYIDQDGLSPLRRALLLDRYGTSNIARYLIVAGADVNEPPSTPQFQAKIIGLDQEVSILCLALSLGQVSNSNWISRYGGCIKSEELTIFEKLNRNLNPSGPIVRRSALQAMMRRSNRCITPGDVMTFADSSASLIDEWLRDCPPPVDGDIDKSDDEHFSVDGEVLKLPSRAPETYSERENRRESPEEFILRVYGDPLETEMTQADLGRLDPKLYQAYRTWKLKNKPTLGLRTKGDDLANLSAQERLDRIRAQARNRKGRLKAKLAQP